jgi:translation initiation factor IF-3
MCRQNRDKRNAVALHLRLLHHSAAPQRLAYRPARHLRRSVLRGRRRLRIPIPPPELNRARANDKIRVPQVRLIDENGGQVGIVSVEVARQKAIDAGLDLVEVAATAKPPVCRIMDFSRHIFEMQKKERAAKRKQVTQEMKEIRLRPGTGQGDMDVKARHARAFFDAGFKVGIQLQFRGRERAHPEVAIEVIGRFAKMLEDIAKIEVPPKQEGKRMTAVLAPLRKPVSPKPHDELPPDDSELEDEDDDLDDEDLEDGDGDAADGDEQA